MKKQSTGLVSMFMMALILLSFSSLAQPANVKLDKKAVAKWYKSDVWLNGLKLKPHKSVNQAELSRQYQLNRSWWDQAFEFLKTHDLETLEPGNYVVDKGNVTVFVSELPTKDSIEINWETHKNFNDLQYIVKGKARMGTTALNDPTAKVTVPYNPKPDVETYAVTGGNYYDAVPGTFFIFSPEDIHKPAFKVAGYDVVKKILIKVRVPQ